MKTESKIEKQYQRQVKAPLSQARKIKEAGVVVGIPFYNETDTIKEVVKIIEEGLKSFYSHEKCVIVCAGSPWGKEALEVVNRIKLSKGHQIERIAFIFDDQRFDGRGWAIRAIMEIAQILKANLAIFSADLRSLQEKDKVMGFIPDWVRLLLDPVKRESVDLVLPKYHRHFFDAKITCFLVSPLITSIYGKRINEPLATEYGINQRLLPKYLTDHTIWSGEVGRYGIDNFLVTQAIVNQAKMCEVDLGIKLYRPSPGKSALRFRGAAEGIFDRIVEDSSFWKERGEIISSLDTYGERKEQKPPEVRLNYRELIGRYRKGISHFHYLYKRILPEDTHHHLLELADGSSQKFNLSEKQWTKIVYHFLLAFGFSQDFHQEDIIEGLNPIFLGRLASFTKDIEALRKKLEENIPEYSDSLLRLEAARIIENQAKEFIGEKDSFLFSWKKRRKAIKPYLPKIGCWEFIPEVPLVVPQEITTRSGRIVQDREVYQSLIDKYRREFQEFISRKLRFEKDTSSVEIIQRIKDFMLEVEKGFNELLFPGSLHTLKGTKEVVRAIFHYFPHNKTFCLKEEAAYKIIRRHPPADLITCLGFADLPQLLQHYASSDALALASWREERKYRERIWDELKEKAKPSDFEFSDLKPLVISYRDFPSLVEMKEQSALNRLTGKIVVSDLPKAKGGEFLKIRYLTTIAKSMVEAERFSQIWEEFSRGPDFSERLINSLRGHWGRTPFSAHNIFENGNQRVLVERIRKMASKIGEEAIKEGDLSRQILVSRIEDLADSYHLALTLPDNSFIPLSAWSWASYSFKGGRDFPTPLSAHIERDWTSRDFLMEYLKAAELGDKTTVERKIIELMGEGKESEDLASHLLGLGKEAEKILISQVSVLDEVSAGKLKRMTSRPIIEPIKDHFWESKFVFNCASVKLRDKYYILYRAVGNDFKASYIGLAWSKDGVKIEGRLDEPIFRPEKDYEGIDCKDPDLTVGCEDPRVNIIGDCLYMLYTANSGYLSQIGLASIEIDDFLSFNWKSWQRYGPTYPGFSNKDAILFSEKFSGKFAVYHRIYPAIWLSYMDKLECPWPSEGHKIVISPRSGMMWDSIKVGAGAQPIKTSFGWLIIYHGVDYLHTYRLGLILVSLNNPGEILYRSPNAILEPERDYEIGEGKGVYWVPRVVFTCGAVPTSDKEILDAEDSILVYYGAADTVIGVAKARVGELIPQQVRERL